MKERVFSELKKSLIILLCGTVYYFLVTKMHIVIPCVFNSITGLLCPGCGVTRMIVAASRFDLVAAYGYNKALFVTWPLIAFVFVSMELEYIQTGKRTIKPLQQIVLWGEVILLILFCIVRNII